MATYTAFDPRSGEALPDAYPVATADDVAATARDSAPASRELDGAGPRRRALLLRAIARRLADDREALVAVADAETALGPGRLDGELNRTVAQLETFADLVEQGDYVEAVIDTASAGLSPPRPDLRRALVPIGPVAMFGAGNFPLAFGVAGTDTASALAVGCAVVAKAHPGHPGTSERAAAAVRAAAGDADLPATVLQLVHGPGPETGTALATDPHVAAVAFTGSSRGGRALMDVAADRPVPIPVFAEMGSANPVVVSPGAARSRAGSIASGFAQSFTLGAGQFCTKPGLVFVPDGTAGDEFVAAVVDALATAPEGHLLSERGMDGLRRQVEEAAGAAGVRQLVGAGPAAGGWSHPVTLFEVGAEDFLASPGLVDELFGPAGIVVRHRGHAALAELVEALPGSLTATVHADDDEIAGLGDVIGRLTDRTGRLIWNGWPTGVAVTAAQMHGGPYPASSNAAHTSIGHFAIRRFLRPVAYQDWPDGALPPALADANPLGLRRLLDGASTTAAVRRDP
ncbi:MAG: aldehyde dehydrogenase (NADP(+)) [Acidimicrobiia bacterium]